MTRDSIPPKPPPGDWSARGNCVGMDPELFFPERWDGHVTARAAVAVCRGCEVQAECLEYAQTTPVERWGVWGGQTFTGRRRLRSGGAA